MKRLPIIRHIRWVFHSWQVERHYKFYASIGMLPVNRHLDEKMLQGIWDGRA